MNRLSGYVNQARAEVVGAMRNHYTDLFYEYNNKLPYIYFVLDISLELGRDLRERIYE